MNIDGCVGVDQSLIRLGDEVERERSRYSDVCIAVSRGRLRRERVGPRSLGLDLNGFGGEVRVPADIGLIRRVNDVDSDGDSDSRRTGDRRAVGGRGRSDGGGGRDRERTRRGDRRARRDISMILLSEVGDGERARDVNVSARRFGFVLREERLGRGVVLGGAPRGRFRRCIDVRCRGRGERDVRRRDRRGAVDVRVGGIVDERVRDRPSRGGRSSRRAVGGRDDPGVVGRGDRRVSDRGD